jgi:hypothetical protein
MEEDGVFLKEIGVCWEHWRIKEKIRGSWKLDLRTIKTDIDQWLIIEAFVV